MHWLKHNMPMQKMKSMQTKAKNKKKNGKLGKVLLSTEDIDNTINPDLSNLYKPIDSSISDLCQVNKLLEDGTEEVKSILLYECDIVYECRICRSLFRSIINLISHKREYCKEKFNATLSRRKLRNYDMIPTSSVVHMYKTGQTVTNDIVKNDRILRSQVHKEGRKMDITAVIDRLNKRKQHNVDSNLSNKSKVESAISNTSNSEHIYLESIDTSKCAVYQTVKSLDISDASSDLMRAQVTELQKMTNQHTITLEGQISENHLEKSDNPIQSNIGDEEDELLTNRLSSNNLICIKCNANFATKKTLTFHMKTLHTSPRLCYPCPYCANTFANTWSVFRHLIKVHRKTNEQVRKLRSLIQEKAFHKETTMMEDLKKACLLTNRNQTTRNSDESQELVSFSDSDIKIHKYSECVCGKRFDRKAALSAHLQYCQMQNATFNKITNTDSNLNKVLDLIPSNTLRKTKGNDVAVNSIIKPLTTENVTNVHLKDVSSSKYYENLESSIRVQDVSSLSKEDWDMLENDHNSSPEYNKVVNNNGLGLNMPPVTQSINNNKSTSLNENQVQNELKDGSKENQGVKVNKKSLSSEIISTDICVTNPSTLQVEISTEQVSNDNNKEQSINVKERDTAVKEKNDKTLSSSSIHPNESEQSLIMEKKIASIANLRKLQCLLCKRKFTSLTNLRRHMAIHIGWNRYRCKLCDFKCFVKCDCVAHCNKMHNAQNNRTVIAEMVIQIPQNEYTCNENVVMDITNLEQKTTVDADTIVPVSPYQTRIHKSNGTNEKNEQITESHEKIADQKIDERGNNENRKESINLMNYESGNLDTYPDLKQMIMEVIFGTNDANATKQTDCDKLNVEINHNNTERGMDIDNENTSVPLDEFKEASCSIIDDLKPQRPTRNKIKPLNADFVYDLKDVSSRKECLLLKNTSLQLDKPYGKHHLHLRESKTLNTRKRSKFCS